LLAYSKKSDKVVNIISNPDATRVEAIKPDTLSDIVSDNVSLEEVERAVKTELSEITIEASPPNLTKAEISELKSQIQNIEIEDIDSDRPQPLSFGALGYFSHQVTGSKLPSTLTK
jgi:hypothetical protein